jgi:hypothetical protein
MPELNHKPTIEVGERHFGDVKQEALRDRQCTPRREIFASPTEPPG